MNLFRFELVRIFSKISTYLVLFVAPLIFATIGGVFFNTVASNNLRIGVHNLDKTPLAKFTVGVVMSLFQGGTVSYVGEDYESKLRSGELHAVVIIPKNFSKALFAGEKTELRYVPSPVDTHMSVAAYIVFRKLFEDLGGGPFFNPRVLQQMYVSQSVPAPELIADSELNFSQAFGPSLILITVMLVSLITAAGSVTEDKERRLFQVYALGNVGAFRYIVPKFLASSLVAMGSGIVAFVVFQTLGFRADPYSIVGLIVVNSVFHTSLGLLISVLSQNSVTSNVVSYGLGFLLFIASGALTSVTSLPEFLKTVVRALPVHDAIYILRLGQFFPNSNFGDAVFRNLLVFGTTSFALLSVCALAIHRQLMPSDQRGW